MDLKNATDAATVIGQVSNTEIYKDSLQPTIRELGKNLHTVSKLITVALTPISAMIWGYEKIGEYLHRRLSEKLENVPEEEIITPDPAVAVPAVEALRYTGHHEELREMFSSLLATSMIKSSANQAHPSYVEIIKQITTEEAKILKSLNPRDLYPQISLKIHYKDRPGYNVVASHFSLIPFQAGCLNPLDGPIYLENLHRLGVIDLNDGNHIVDLNKYNDLVNHDLVNAYKLKAKDSGAIISYIHGYFTLTTYGEQLYNTCITSK